MNQASEYLKKATEYKSAGEIDKAVSYLRKAYEEISKTEIDYGVETFLRLPLYLQSAKKNTEAWREFNLLLTNGYPNQPEFDENIRSKVYDKMRLFLQREGRNSLAISYGILSYIFDLKSRFLAGQQDDLQRQYFDQYATRSNIERMVKALLKKANKEEFQKDLCLLIEKFIKRMPDVYRDEIEDEVAEIVSGKNA